jgi:hypothetical protein
MSCVLNYRLTGTTECIGINHNEQPPVSTLAGTANKSNLRPIFAHHGAPQKTAPYC